MRYQISRWLVTAAAFSLLAIPRVHAASQATGLTITPASATITADQQQAFVVNTTNADGTTADVTGASTLSIDDPLGTITGATYSAGKTGTWKVQASYQSFNAMADMTVTAGALAEVDINPNSDPEYATIGKTKQFTADGFDQDKNVVADMTVSWSVIGEIGTITPAGVFIPSTIGTGKVQAQSGSVIGQVAVVVSEQPATNTNDNTNTTNTNVGTANTNTTNTNVAPPADSNANVPVISISSDTANDGLKCKTLHSWLWILLLVVILAAVFILYALVPATKFWPVIVALLAAGILTFIQRKYGCALQGWWAWAMIIGTVAISLLAVRQSTPKKPL